MSTLTLQDAVREISRRQVWENRNGCLRYVVEGEWDETKHRRGQPGNAGQFASQGRASGSVGAKPTSSEQPKGAARAAAAPDVIKKLVSDEEAALPKSVGHQHKTKEAAFAAAKAAKPAFDRGLDTGKGVDEVLGATVVRPNTPEEMIASLDTKGPLVILAPIKSERRANEKVEDDYKGDWTKITDLVRATVAVDTVAELPKAMEAIRAKMPGAGWKIATLPKNRFDVPVPGGYRDILLRLTNDSGMVAELQVNLKGIVRVKESEGHDVYEQLQKIDRACRSQKRYPTPEEDAQVKALQDKLEPMYERALKQAGG
jgi:hypothetical protein